MSTALSPTVPPQNIEAEESVLGAMLLSERAVADVTEVIADPGDFYREANGTIFRAMQHLLARSEPLDAITVTSELAKLGVLDDVGGAEFVHGLTAAVPAAANARQYARIVHDLAVFRRLVNAGVSIAQLGYERAGEVREAVDQAEGIIFNVSQARVGGDLLPVSELLVEEFERIDKLQQSGSTLTGTPTGLKGLDGITSGLQPSNLVILAARPSMGKTALALGIARHIGAERNIPVAVFSLEMSRYEIVQRLMCSQALVDSQRLRTGRMQPEDWSRLTTACDQLMRAPIYIDDTAGTTVMEIRSKARRLKAQQPALGLIVVDYLQLMGSSERPESRVQEISQISRAMKVLARDLGVPVMALSQLSRAVESRTDKRPMLSDLRESGCLAGDSRVFMPDEGGYRTMRELAGTTGFRVLALDRETWRLEPRVVTNAFSTGHKPVYRLTTRLGRTIRATANHPFLAFDGWTRLDALQPGRHIAVPRELWQSNRAMTRTPEELALLAHLIGDGCTLPRHAIQYTTRELALAELVRDLATAVFGDAIRPRIVRERNWYQVYLPSAAKLTHGRRNPVAAWLDEMGVFGLRSHEKRVPADVFRQPVSSVIRFLRHLWATDGCVWHNGRSQPRIYYATSSHQLALDVQSLLLRVGINATVRTAPASAGGWWVDVSSGRETLRFVDYIGGIASRARHLWSIREYITKHRPRTGRDVIPADAWRDVIRPAMREKGISTRAFQSAIGTAYCGTTIERVALGRERAERAAAVLDSPELTHLAHSDVYWDVVDSVVEDGVEETFDLTVEGLSNFVVNSIICHNSIEQDADVVLFIYRDDYYNREESEKKGLAELIVAKHRNGATGSIDLAFRERYTLFSDLARGEA